MPAPTVASGVNPVTAPFTSEYVIEAVKRRAAVPISQATLETWELLSITDEQIRSIIAPMLIDVEGDYLTANYDQPIAAAVYRYGPHRRQVKLREVRFIDEDGHDLDVPRIALEHLEHAQDGFHFSGSQIVLINPSRWDGCTLRQVYYARPSRLVLTTDVGVVASVLGGAITLAAAAPARLTGNVVVDIVRGVAPFDLLASDVPAVVAGAVATVDVASVPAGLAAGDFVCLAEETPVPQIPPDLHPLLAQATAAEVLDQIGDSDAYQRAAAKMQGLLGGARALIVDRVPGEPVSWAGANPLWDRGWR